MIHAFVLLFEAGAAKEHENSLFILEDDTAFQALMILGQINPTVGRTVHHRQRVEACNQQENGV